MNESAIFNAAVKLPAGQRAEFLAAVCADNANLQANVESLLREHEDESAGFLDAASLASGRKTCAPIAVQPGSRIGPYKLLEQIGEGGMGVVYVAEQIEPVRRRVALKIIKPGMDTKQVIARFEAERQALAMMDHPHIARVLDAGTTEQGRPFFVMELVRGMPITEYCDKARLSPRQRLELFIDVCQAVQHAHQKGIIHRDLKPSNVMVTTNDGRRVVKVIDFGVAKAVSHQLTERTLYTALTQLVGTPLYMSPEQAELTSHDVDTRSDVYSLGVLLYELLTGQTPFDKERMKSAGFDEMRRIIREEEPLRPSHRVSTLCAQASTTISQQRGLDERHLGRVLRGELDWIVMEALEKDRSRRYESASALAADIQRYLSDEPVLACPPTTMYRFQKFARKHKPALFTAAAVALCLILGTTVSAWQAVRATTAEAQANANEEKAQDAAAAEAKQRNRAEVNEQKANAERDDAKALAERLQRTLYAAHMNLAHDAWEAGNIGRVNELLNQHRPKPTETDRRGFEWHYLYRLCHAELLTIQGGSPAFSPDGKRLACFDENTVKVRDAQTGQELLACGRHTEGVESLTFSPDGKRIASWGGIYWDKTKNAYAEQPRGELKIWNAQTGQELLDSKGHADWIMSAAFRPDGQRIATASLDNTVKVWDAQTGQDLLTIKNRTKMAYSVAFSPDGKRLAGAGQDGATVWDAETGQELLTPKGGSWSVKFSPDGKRLASGKSVLDAQTGEVLFTLDGDGEFRSFSKDGKRLAGPGGARIVKVWDAHTGQELFTFKGHTNRVGKVVFSPDGFRLASSSHDGTVKIWDATTSPEARTVRDLGSNASNIVSLSFSPNGKRLVTGTGTWKSAELASFVAEVKVWDAENSQELLALKGPAHLPVFSPDGKRLAGAGGGVRVWDAQTGQDLLTLKGHEQINNVTYSPDGKHLASAAEDGTVKVWDAESGPERFTLKGHTAAVWSVAFSPDGKRLATNSRDGMVKVWDVQSSQELLSIQRRSGQRNEHASNVVFSPDGKRLASCLNKGQAGAGEIRIWDSLTGEELLSLKGHTLSVFSVFFSPDGKRLVSGSGDFSGSGEMKVWDAQTGDELLSIPGGVFNHRVAFTPDGHRLASNAGGTVKIYDATPVAEKP